MRSPEHLRRPIHVSELAEAAMLYRMCICIVAYLASSDSAIFRLDAQECLSQHVSQACANAHIVMHAEVCKSALLCTLAVSPCWTLSSQRPFSSRHQTLAHSQAICSTCLEGLSLRIVLPNSCHIVHKQPRFCMFQFIDAIAIINASFLEICRSASLVLWQAY